MAKMRAVPPAVVQQSEWWCWAACLEILNRGIGNRFHNPVLIQSEWVDFLRTSPVGARVMNPQGGIRVQSLPYVFGQLGMRFHNWPGPSVAPPPPRHATPMPTPPELVVDIPHLERCLGFSYLLAGFPVAGGTHFVVVFGVDAQRVHYFDPVPGRGVRAVTHAEVRAGPLLIGWKP